MTDRLLVFSNPEVQKLLHEKFIPVACNDWYQRRRQDAEGEFFRAMANQGPRKGQGGSTRQGHYVFTASGKLLGYNNNRGPEKRLRMMHDALRKWHALPPAEKSAPVPGPYQADPKFQRTLPRGGTVIKVHSRTLEENNGRLTAMAQPQTGSMAAVDHMWLTEKEVSRLHNIIHNGGGELPAPVTYRLARYHLVDNTRGEPPFWQRNEVGVLMLRVDDTGKITGRFEQQTKDGQRGFLGKGHGQIQFDAEGNIKSFTFLVTGRHWGEGPYTRGSRPGKSPLGFVFQLCDGKKPQDTIPPQGIHWEKGYWEADH
ncbi:MAG: hypothetical protein H7A51_17365 [Akkermansiaceae bacterium]|nr:hypothetical protein [Akkermansiaceae bacterium]